MASPLSTHFDLNGPLEASTLAHARAQLAPLGVTRLDEDLGVMLFVTYDPSEMTHQVLVAKLRSLGVPIA
jgi:hypothetical protein